MSSQPEDVIMDSESRTPSSAHPTAPALLRDPDEINLLEYAYVLVKAKWWIIGLTALGLVAGYVAALIKGPSYVAEAVIAPRESESAKSSANVSGLGMFGGLVASQLSLASNPSLEKIDVVLNSRKFNAEVAKKYVLYPFLFPKIWDPVNSRWAAGAKIPKELAVGGYLKKEFIEGEIEKNKTMSIKVTTQDSVFTDTLVRACLEHLDTHIRTTTQREAKENRDYLESQLLGVTDPLLRAKIQELIASEVEKMMVVSKEAFSVIDPPMTGMLFREKKLYPLLVGFAFFFLTCLWVVMKHAFSSGEKTREDRELIDGIRREIRKRPFGE